MANRNDVARTAGVSGATVSRAFNYPGSLLRETYNKVIKAAIELDYSPNIIARNFARKKSGNIGVVIPQIPNVHIFSTYYFSEILSGIGEMLSEKGYDLLLQFHKSSENTPKQYHKYFEGGRVDGCILMGTYVEDHSLLELKEKGYLFCLVNNYFKNNEISYIDVDNILGSYIAVKYLIELGHKDIAFLNGPKKYTNSIDREKGYLKALKEYSISTKQEYFFEGNYGYKSGYNAASELLDKGKMPTAVFVSNDRMAAGLIEGLKKNGISVPDDISVIGYDDSDIAITTQPRITTIKIPFYQLGLECAKQFITLIEAKEKKNFEILIKPEMVIRETTRKRGNI